MTVAWTVALEDLRATRPLFPHSLPFCVCLFSLQPRQLGPEMACADCYLLRVWPARSASFFNSFSRSVRLLEAPWSSDPKGIPWSSFVLMKSSRVGRAASRLLILTLKAWADENSCCSAPDLLNKMNLSESFLQALGEPAVSLFAPLEAAEKKNSFFISRTRSGLNH